MLEAGWLKSIKAALLAGLIGFVGVAEAKDVYYVSGYWGKPGSDGAHMVVKTEAGAEVSFPISDDDVLVVRAGNSDSAPYGTTLDLAYVSTDVGYIPKNIRIEKDFTLYPGVTNKILGGTTIEIVDGATLTISSSRWTQCSVGTVVFEGDGTIDLSGAKEITDPLTISAGMKFKLPENSTISIVISDPENLDMSDYPDYILSVGEDGVARLVKEDTVVAYVGDAAYSTLADAFSAAKPSGTIRLVGWPTSNLPAWTDAAQWQGIVQFSGTMPNGFTPANYGNAKSTIEFKGVSGGFLEYSTLKYAGTVKLTNNGTTPAWTVNNGFSSEIYKYEFAHLTGDGDLVDTGSGVTQPYAFKDVSTFRGSIRTVGKKITIGESAYGVAGGIHIETGKTAFVADKKTWSATDGILIDGTIGGSGTLACNVVFGDTAVIDLTDGVLTATSIVFGSTLTLKNVKPGDTILKCTTTDISGNYNIVKLCDESGVVQPFWSLKYEYHSDSGSVLKLSGGEKKLSGNESWTVDAATAANFPTPLVLDLTDYYGEGGGKPVGETAHTVITFPVGTDASTYLSKIQVVYPTLHAAGELTAEGNKIFFTFGHLDLYWSKWRGTFWEAVFGGDIHGNNGFGRTEAGATQAILAGDTVIFDKEHYQVDGEFAQQSPYWHYDENLYIKDEVNPGVNNDWDLKVLEGVTLKMGLRGARTTGQNIITDFKIYVEGGSTLELGYWGNTHHYQGVIRPDVTFGGLGTITLGDDVGASCRIEGDLKVKGGETPTLDVRGKELVVQGGRIDVNLTGFGALSGSGTITTPITFNNATISATTSPGFTFKNETTFTGTLTVDMARAPTGEELIKICTKGEGGSFSFKEGIDVVVRVGGSVQPAFYTLATDTDGNLCVKVAPVQITYDAEVVLGYDYKTMIVDVDMNPAIAGVVAEVTVADVEGKLQHWSASVIGMRNQGRAEVMVGDADDNFAPGTYSMTVSVGSWHKDLEFTLAAQNDGNLAMVGGVGYKTMKDAVAAAEAARGTGNGTIKLLTNVFFAPPPGNYMIERGEYDVYITNDMEMTVQESAVTITAPETIDHYVIWTGYPFVIEGNWLGTALPWKTRKQIKSALTDKSAINGLKPFEAYVLGIPAAEMGTYKPIAYGVQTDDPNTIELTDNLPTKSAEETGVVVTKKIIDEKTKLPVSETTTYDLSTMDGKSKLLKLDYSFASDRGQG